METELSTRLGRFFGAGNCATCAAIKPIAAAPKKAGLLCEAEARPDNSDRAMEVIEAVLPAPSGLAPRAGLTGFRQIYGGDCYVGARSNSMPGDNGLCQIHYAPLAPSRRVWKSDNCVLPRSGLSRGES